MPDPILPFLQQQGVLLLDGGLATELEARGLDLNDPLWSAKVLLEDPDVIRQVHIDYLRAGADCIVSASYQATLSRLQERGLTEAEAAENLRSAVRLAVEARDGFWSDPQNRPGRLRPLVAASVGPYGAYLADGSEYTGGYGLTSAELQAFHEPRWHVLAQVKADLMACETLPSHEEGRALLELLRATPGVYAWFSFTCRDAEHISDGSPLIEVLEELEDEPRVVAVGVNCTSPAFIPNLIGEARKATAKPIIVYPNSGERYDAGAKRWKGDTPAVDFGRASELWRAAGATLIGGCCRTGPGHVREIRSCLLAPA
jgi:homocysteine S-methyltransferase